MHENLSDGTSGQKYIPPQQLSPSIVCTVKFWEELAYFVVFQYEGRSRSKALMPGTVEQYLRKSMLCMQEKHGKTHAPFFANASESWWGKVCDVTWKKAAEIRTKLGQSVVSEHRDPISSFNSI